MKKNTTTLAYIIFLSSLFSCNNKKDNENTLWAGEVESKTMVIKPEGFQDEYWQSINKNVDYDKIFKTLVDAVLKEKKQAYDIITDKLLTVDEVKEIMGLSVDALDKVSVNDLSAIRMRESWVFNEKEFTLEKKVKRIDLLLKKIDPVTGEYLGDKALFYIKIGE